MIVVGIDPGVDGGIVALDEKSRVLLKEVMPVYRIGKYREVDDERMNEIFVRIQSLGEVRVFLERIMVYAMSATGAFSFGRNYGRIEGFIRQYGLSVIYVEPTKWCAEMHQGIDARLKPKEKSRIALERLFPGVDLQVGRQGKPHEGLMDGLLIAAFGRRRVK